MLNYSNYDAFFDETVRMVEKVIGTDDADLSPFHEAGGKLIMWHGWAPQTPPAAPPHPRATISQRKETSARGVAHGVLPCG